MTEGGAAADEALASGAGNQAALRTGAVSIAVDSAVEAIPVGAVADVLIKRFKRVGSEAAQAAAKNVDELSEAATKAVDDGVSIKGGRGTPIHNDVLDSPRTGSALKVDEVSPIYEINTKTGRPQIVKEFPATTQAHGFNDIVDNYAGYATKTSLGNADLYQLEGALNGVPGRFEWIIQDGSVTHRMFIQNGTMKGVPIKP